VIPLTARNEYLKAYPQFPIPRLVGEGEFEPRVAPAGGRTAFSSAFIDIGSPYVIIPYKVHHLGLLRVYQDFGPQPYSLPSMAGAPVLQRFVEVGIHFLVAQPTLEYRPAQYAQVKAYLLAKNIRPTDRVVIGLDAIRTHFPLFTGAAQSFFLEPGDVVQIP
jgi:hypothetical protein